MNQWNRTASHGGPSDLVAFWNRDPYCSELERRENSVPVGDRALGAGPGRLVVGHTIFVGIPEAPFASATFGIEARKRSKT